MIRNTLWPRSTLFKNIRSDADEPAKGTVSSTRLHGCKAHCIQMLWVAIPMYNTSLACTKFSILFQYLRIFPRRPFRIACYIAMCVVALYSTWAIITGFLTCVPVAKFWDRSVKGYCFNFGALWFFNASMNIATDLALLLMPMPLLSQLHLPRMQKFALCGVFAIGGFVVITSALRLSSLYSVARDPDTSCKSISNIYTF